MRLDGRVMRGEGLRGGMLPDAQVELEAAGLAPPCAHQALAGARPQASGGGRNRESPHTPAPGSESSNALPTPAALPLAPATGNQ